MIVQEPVQAAIWHCLNHYDYSDAVFLSERLYAEVKSDDSLFLLATALYRNGQKDQAYHTLKDKTPSSTQCRYLLGICAYDLEKYAEAEAALLQKTETEATSLDDIATEYGEQASFALSLLGNIAAKTERKSRAIDAWRKALKINPFQWSSYESLCKIGDKPNPQTIFQVGETQNLSMLYHHQLGSNFNTNNFESVFITPNNNDTNQHDAAIVSTPQQILVNLNSNSSHLSYNNSKLCTPEDNPQIPPQSLWPSGLVPLSSTRAKPSMRFRADSISTPQSTFAQFIEADANYIESPISQQQQPKLTESNSHHQSLAKRMKAQVDQIINRREPILSNCKPLFSQSTNVAKTPTIPLNVQQQPCQNVRRSSRLFSNSYSVKENNKSPNRNKFATPKSPSRKTKRITKCNLNKSAYSELNTRNKLEKEKTETITTTAETKMEKGGAISNSTSNNNLNNMENSLQHVMFMQKQIVDGLMNLLKLLGQAYLDYANFNCKQAIENLHDLPSNQFQTSWVYSMLGLCHFELAEYDVCIKYFSQVHTMEPHRIQFMDIYSTALWHLQKEVTLSALAQDLIALNKNSPVTWCVSGNCFSLHKEHDTAIKFFQRAVQVDQNFPYAYTLLGHEYITTEELDKALSCFRNAIRLDPRHYNAWFGIGNIYAKQERYLLAELNYNRALSINTQSSVILCHIAIVQHALKNTEKALKTLNKAIANNPKSPLCKFHRGSIYFALDRHEEALKELNELKEIVPKESLVYYLIGRVHKKLGNTDLALMHINWATDLDPKGASSQIKEAFDPSIRNSTSATVDDDESPQSPIIEDVSAHPAGLQPGVLNFSNLPDDSEDSF